jgi:hypothetical protein
MEFVKGCEINYRPPDLDRRAGLFGVAISKGLTAIDLVLISQRLVTNLM